MTTITNNDLMMAILSMDAYFQKNTGDQIGDAKVVKVTDINRPDGFFAVAYNYDGTTVISYRGTDNARVTVTVHLI